MSTHTAVAITQPGTIGTIQVATVAPEEGQVLLKVEYTSLIAFDTYMADLAYSIQSYPVIPGFNASGTVAAVGLGVDDLVVGDRVTTHCFAMFNAKGAQEYTLQPSYAFSKIPDSISLAEAATIPDNLITAFYTLFNQLKLPIPSSFPTEEVTPLTSTPILIYGAGSTSGQYAVQLLQAAGYNQVLATASTKHHNYLKSIGATHTFDYNNPTLVEDVAKAVGGDGKVPLVVDCIAGETSLKTLADIVSPDGAVAILLPIKSSTRTITVKQADDFRMGLPEDNTPFAPTVKVLGVRTFLYAQDEFLKKNLASKIIPNLLKSGLIKPNRVRLLDQGTLEERIQEGLELLRNNRVSGEKVVVKVWP